MRTIVIVGIEFDLNQHPRIVQVINTLHGNARLIGIGLGKGNPKLDEFYSIQSPVGFIEKIVSLIINSLKYYIPGLLRFRYKQILEIIQNVNPDQIWIHHFESGVLVKELSFDKVFFSHTNIPGQNDGDLFWRLSKKIMINKEFPEILRSAKTVFVESNHIKRDYLKLLGKPKDIRVIPNTREFPQDLSLKLIKENDIRIVHHGIAAPSRGLEMIIDAVGQLNSNYSLYLYLVPSKRNRNYIKKLKKKAKRYSNIHFMNPVPYALIVQEMSRYDLGICMFKSQNYHTLYATVPNKYWEYVGASVVPVVWSQSAMAEIVKSDNLGLICQELTSDSLSKLLKNIDIEQVNELRKSIYNRRLDYSSKKTITPELMDVLLS